MGVFFEVKRSKLATFKNFQAFVEKKIKKKIKILRMDLGGESSQRTSQHFVINKE